MTLMDFGTITFRHYQKLKIIVMNNGKTYFHGMMLLGLLILHELLIQ